MATVAHRLECRINLVQRPLGHASVSPPFSDPRAELGAGKRRALSPGEPAEE
jgi:hypothetical protein